MTHAPQPIAALDLYRISHNDDGTPGHIRVGPHNFATLELPWRHNAREISCIPAGRYYCERGAAPSFPKNYALANVPDRAGIVIHAGNYAGDISRGWKSDSRGCILLGRACVIPAHDGKTQRAVCLSRASIRSLGEIMKGAPFWLTIHPPLTAAEQSEEAMTARRKQAV